MAPFDIWDVTLPRRTCYRGAVFKMNDTPFMPPDGRHLFQFTQYLQKYYTFDSSKYPPLQWAYQNVTSQCTTNTCEKFHSSFAMNFMQAVKDQQISTSILCISMHARKKVRKCYEKRKNRLECLIENCKCGNLDSVDFLKKVNSHHTTKY